MHMEKCQFSFYKDNFCANYNWKFFDWSSRVIELPNYALQIMIIFNFAKLFALQTE